jgi:hypothetical protein
MRGARMWIAGFDILRTCTIMFSVTLMQIPHKDGTWWQWMAVWTSRGLCHILYGNLGEWVGRDKGCTSVLAPI